MDWAEKIHTRARFHIGGPEARQKARVWITAQLKTRRLMIAVFALSVCGAYLLGKHEGAKFDPYSSFSQPPEVGRYQLGRIGTLTTRIDTATGHTDVWLTEKGWVPLPERRN
jgi:hypothetical protein